MIPYVKQHMYAIGLVLMSSIFYGSFGYDLAREDTLKLLGLMGGTFFFTYKILSWERENFKLLIAAGLVYRMILFMSIPELSQDFYRYIWDGALLNEGINPYLYKPIELITSLKDSLPNASYLYEKMGSLSQNHYSNYPPISQYIYALAAYIGQESIATAIGVFRAFILGADLAILFLCRWLMKQLGLPSWKAFWYFLNPLVIVELSGNLHLEGVMIAFFLAALCLIITLGKRVKSHQKGGIILKEELVIGMLVSLSIMTKLIPILFYPFLGMIWGFKRWFRVGLIILVCCTLLLWPLAGTGFFNNYIETIGLWFHNFEFNASLYNLIKTISKSFGNSAYRTIITYGKILPFLIIGIAIAVLIWQYKRRGATQDSTKISLRYALFAMLFMYTGHLFIATTVHPWYLIFGVVLSLFTPFSYFLLWSLSVMLSYATYAVPDFKENLWLLGFEYLLVYGYFFYEIVKIKTSNFYSVKNV